MDFLSNGWVDGCEWLRDEWDITVEDVVAGVLNDPDPYYLWRRMRDDFRSGKIERKRSD